MTPMTILFGALLAAAPLQDEWWPLEPGEVSHWEFEWSDVFTPGLVLCAVLRWRGPGGVPDAAYP